MFTPNGLSLSNFPSTLRRYSHPSHALYMLIHLVLPDFIILAIYDEEYYLGVELPHRFVRCG
jgi:hypothetical protein